MNSMFAGCFDPHDQVRLLLTGRRGADASHECDGHPRGRNQTASPETRRVAGDPTRNITPHIQIERSGSPVRRRAGGSVSRFPAGREERKVNMRQNLQLKGDPAIRQFLFEQTRAESLFDTRMDELLLTVEHLFLQQSVFHAKIHFSSNQLTLWLLDDPYNYRVLAGEEVFARADGLLLADIRYPREAEIEPQLIRPLLRRFRELRLHDDIIYLRAASINIMNGSIGLKFSCDGSHYVDHREFLANPHYKM
jgi:hypothetical protein